MTATEPPALGGFQILTSPGPAAIAIIRLWGYATRAFLEAHVRVRPPETAATWVCGRVVRGQLLDSDGAAIDDLLISVHAAPPEWDLRLHLHGSPWVVRRCAELLRAGGFQEPPEASTTLWPAANAIEADACALLPKMLTLRGARWLMDQAARLPDALRRLADSAASAQDRAECQQLIDRSAIFDCFARPSRVALVGPPNAGKSTLANALADQQVSLVSPIPGTTRDWVEVPGEACGFPVIWLDTAGLCPGADALEAEGIARTRRVLRAADAVVLVLDATAEAQAARAAFAAAYADVEPALTVLNKCDLIRDPSAALEPLPGSWWQRSAPVSAKCGVGLDRLVALLASHVGPGPGELDRPAAFCPRQVRHLEAALAATDRKCFSENILRCLHDTSPQ